MMAVVVLAGLALAGKLLYEWRRQKLIVAALAAMPTGSRLRDLRRDGTILEVSVENPRLSPGPGRGPAGRTGRGPGGVRSSRRPHRRPARTRRPSPARRPVRSRRARTP